MVLTFCCENVGIKRCNVSTNCLRRYDLIALVDYHQLRTELVLQSLQYFMIG